MMVLDLDINFITLLHTINKTEYFYVSKSPKKIKFCSNAKLKNENINNFFYIFVIQMHSILHICSFLAYNNVQILRRRIELNDGFIMTIYHHMNDDNNNK